MNSAVIALVGIIWLVIAYRIYGKIIERKVIGPDDSQKTPAHRLRDDVDYYPANPLVLFGHHFASIAGAGPIIGPVIAVAAFGWGVSLLWILVGVIVVGAVHDYTTLMISIRCDGQSIPEITRRVVDGKTRMLFQVFVWITLIFIIAIFVIAAAKSFIAYPKIVIPAFGLIPLAMIFGWLVNRIGLPLWLGTIAALVLLIGLFFTGMNIPVAMPFERGISMQIWIVILMLYGAIAAVLPVWLLLQPRDYIAYWILAVGLIVGFVGLFVTHKPISAPFLTGVVSERQGPIWPMLFVLIACGAVSGFHSLVSSGTTAKQLSKETHGRPIAFGAMVTEGGLALLALLAVAAGLDYGGSETDPGASVSTLESYLGKGGGGPIIAFAVGFGAFTKPFMGEAGALFGMTMLNAFVLTTLDTSVRISRFVTVELAGPVAKPMENRYLATLVVVLCAYALAATGSEGTLWPMFGAANQLVAALAMIVVTAYLVQRGKPSIYTVVPATFMLLTACGALAWKGYSYLTLDEPNYILTVAALVLLVLAVYVGLKGFGVIRRGSL